MTGYVYDSAAVRADALNNMTDILVSVAVIVGLKISIKPADQNHPYGHLKSENISIAEYHSLSCLWEYKLL